MSESSPHGDESVDVLPREMVLAVPTTDAEKERIVQQLFLLMEDAHDADIDELRDIVCDPEGASIVFPAMAYVPSEPSFKIWDGRSWPSGWSSERRLVGALLGDLFVPRKGVLRGKIVCDLNDLLQDCTVDCEYVERWLINELKKYRAAIRFDVIRITISRKDRTGRKLYKELEFTPILRTKRHIEMVWAPGNTPPQNA